jgi:hypothetical protein
MPEPVTTSVLSRPDYCVLNAVALKKMATTAALVAGTGLPEDQVAASLAGLAERGLVVIASGSVFTGDSTEAALAASASGLYAQVRADPEVISMVDRFDDINWQLLASMSAWQQVDVGGQKVANDHTDSRYDDRIIERIGRLVERLGPLLDALARFDGRFAGYRQRFGAALAGIDEGRHELVSAPSLDSVHTIWFEFHEDLLRTMGRARKE